MPGTWWVGGPLFLFASLVSLAQIRAVPPVKALLPEAACALKISGECALKALHRSFEVILDVGQTAVVILGEKTGRAGASSGVRVKINDDLQARRLKGEISEAEVETVSSDLTKLEGVHYRLPELEKLKTDLGFAKDSEVEKDDLRDLVRTHLQLTFGLQPGTAKYFTEKMGLENADDIEPRVAELKPNRN